MSAAVAAAAFLAGAVISLAVSWLLVSRLERVGERLGLSEALLGLVAALAADAPEVTAAVTAMAGHQQRLGAGVVIGSNVFNLAALLGLGAVVAGRIRLHRRVVVLGGAVAMWVAAACLAVVLGLVPPVAGLAAASGAVAAYAIVLGAGEQGLGRLPLPRAWISWLRSAVAEEELELQEVIRPQRARRQDAVVAAGSLLVVVAASVMMERAASALGSRFAVPEIVVGALVLAAVTSLPNAVAAVWLAGRGRGAATLSTALNSNALNITIGLLLPAAVIGLGRPDGQTTLIAAWYVGLTAVVLAFAYRDRGISRAAGILVIAAYLLFAGSLLASAYTRLPQPQMAIAAGLTAAVAFAVLLASRRRHPGDHKARPAPGLASGSGERDQCRPGSPQVSGHGRVQERGRARAPWPHQSQAGQESRLAGWPVRRLWILGLALTAMAAAADAALGARVVLIGLLIIGPCSVLPTGRWVPTGITGLWATGLAVVLGIPDRIWGTTTHLAFLAAVAVVALANTAAAAIIETRGPLRPR
jgi:cation:H+ antiporter